MIVFVVDDDIDIEINPADLKIDTHGAAVSDPVWALLAEAYRVHGRRPTLLERDFNFPPFAELVDELGTVRRHLAGTGNGARHVA